MLNNYRNTIMGLLLGSFTIAHAATDCNQVTEIPVSECQELLNFYNSTNKSTYWTDKIGWNETNTPCNWYGVTCASGHVTALSLAQTSPIDGLQGEVPDINLPELKEFNILSSALSGSIPNFSHLPKLQKLRFFGTNRFASSIPDFTNLPNLQFLYIRDEGDLSVNVPDFSHLPNLKELILSFSKFSSIPNFSNLPNLEQLYISSGLLMNDIGPYVPSLYLLPDYLKTLTLPDFNFPKLTHLNIVGVDFTGNSIPNFSKMPNLVVLNLQSNNLAGSIPNFSNLPNLVTLELAYNYLTGNIPNFANVPKLGGLNLAANYLTGSIPNFSNLPSLLGINLKNNLLSGAIPNFASLSNINPLYSKVRGNCGLTAYDKTQEELLNKVLPDWTIQQYLPDLRLSPVVPCFALPICPTATISPLTLNLHIPTLSYNNSNMSANLRFVQRDGKVFFELIDYKVNSALLEPIDCIDDPAVTCKKPKPSCSSANLSPDFKLHIPTAIFGDMKLWADLQLHSVENNKITFELVNYGNT